jgi:3-dehydroquinate synthetase
MRVHPSVDLETVLDTIRFDKKRTAAGVGFVLLSEPGQPRTGEIVDPVKVREAVMELYP